LGIGDWGLGIGDWGLGPIPNPQYFIFSDKNIFFRFNCLNYYINLISKENDSKELIYKKYNV
jgi:hypothetical protein